MLRNGEFGLLNEHSSIKGEWTKNYCILNGNKVACVCLPETGMQSIRAFFKFYKWALKVLSVG